jgi:hypothetical protein
MLEGVLDQLTCNIAEDETGFTLTNSSGQAIMFMDANEN